MAARSKSTGCTATIPATEADSCGKGYLFGPYKVTSDLIQVGNLSIAIKGEGAGKCKFVSTTIGANGNVTAMSDIPNVALNQDFYVFAGGNVPSFKLQLEAKTPNGRAMPENGRGRMLESDNNSAVQSVGLGCVIETIPARDELEEPHFAAGARAKVVISKTGDDGRPLPGAEIVIKDKATSKEVFRGVTDADGKVTTGELDPGNYVFVEGKAPDGYILDNKEHTFIVNEDGTVTGEQSLTNRKTSVEIQKVDADTGAGVAGAQIGVYRAGDNQQVTTVTSGADGKAIVIITHKLHEVMSLSDKVAVLRKGQYIGTVNTSETNPQALTDMMVGHAVTLNIDRPRYENPVPRLTLQDVTCYDNEGVVRLDHVSFTAMGGEILGVAGIAGSGQRELLESIAGLYPVAEGSIRYTPEGAPESELVGKTPMQIKKSGVALAFVPEDRLGMGLVGSMGMTGNMMLRSWKKGKGVFVNRKDPNELAMNIWKELEVVTPSTEFPVRRMSGGNVQKVLVGREIAQSPSVLMTAYAVRGLDINTSYTIYNLLTEQKMKGVAVVYVGEDLDVLLELCDRIVVLCGGQVSGVVDARKTDKRQVGVLMTRVEGEKAENE